MDVIGYVSDIDEMATVDGRTYRKAAGSYLQAGESVTKKSTLDTRGPGNIRVGRAVGGGAPRSRKDTRGMGAVTALGTTANNGDWTGRIMAKPPTERGRRTVVSNGWRSRHLPGEIFPTRAAMLRAVKAAA